MKKILLLRYCCIVLLSTLSSNTTLAKNNQDTLKCNSFHANAAFKKGMQLFYEGAIDSSWNYFMQSYNCYEILKEWDNYIDAKLFEIRIVYEKNRIDDGIACAQQVLPLAQKHYPINDTLTGSLYNLISFLYAEKGDYQSALAYTQEAIVVNQKQDNVDYNIISLFYSNMIAYCRKQEDFSKGLVYANQALALLAGNLEQNKKEFTYIYNDLGNVYLDMQEYEKSIEYFKQALILFNQQEKNNEIKKDNIVILNNISMIYQNLSNYQEAALFVQKAKQLSLETNNYDLDYVYRNIGRNNLLQKNYKKALTAFKLALQIRASKYKYKSYKIAVMQDYIGQTYHQQNQLKLALQHYQKALIHFAPNFNDTTDIYNNPPLTNVNDKAKLLQTLQHKAQALYTYFQTTQNLKDLKASLATYQLADLLITQMRQGFLAETSKHFLAERVLPIYEGGIQTILALYQQTKNTKYQDMAFTFAEKSKALSLLEALQENEAKIFANIPPKLLEQQQQLKIDVSYYQRQINKQSARKLSDEQQQQVKIWKQRVFQLQEEAQQLQQQLERDYPKYYQWKYQLNIAHIKDIQQQVLPDANTALIEYFVGDNSIYIFTITQHDIAIHQLPKQSMLNKQMEELRHVLQKEDKGKQVKAEVYFKTAYQLYQQLVEKALPKDISIQQLLIVPDDFLHYLSFEALVTQPTATNVSYSSREAEVSYLLEDYAISYSYSSTLLLENENANKKASATATFLGFAPSFIPVRISSYITEDTILPILAQQRGQRNCNGSVLTPLIHNVPEITYINNIVNGQIYIDSAANKANFQANAPNYKILHLATHACANDKATEHSHIHFSDEDLLTFEIYNLPLNAELAVLSACQTGTGQLKKGEGVMSLARAFMYAGCPSVITSLWSVDDASTEKIMNQFYTHLKQGKNKAKALQQAKLDYVKNADNDVSHPHFWAAFIPIGNIDPIYLNESHSIWWYLLIIALFPLLYWRYQKK